MARSSIGDVSIGEREVNLRRADESECFKISTGNDRSGIVIDKL